GIEGDPSHRLWTSGVQRHPGSGPDLEPSDHAEDTAIGGTGGQEAVLVPEVETIEGADVVAALLRYIETIEERIDLVLRHRDVVGDEPVEEVAPACAIVGEEHMHHEVSQVQDRAVDIKDDTQLVQG